MRKILILKDLDCFWGDLSLALDLKLATSPFYALPTYTLVAVCNDPDI